MPGKLDPDARTGDKLLRLFRKLLFDNRRHFLQDLARELNCSPQTIIRLMEQIESAVGIALEMGIDQRRRWYRLDPGEKGHLGLDFEELRFLTMCRQMAVGILPEPTLLRVDATIRRLAMHMADPHFLDQDDFAFYIKGRINYTPFADDIERLVRAARTATVCRLTYKAVGRAEARTHRFIPVRMAAMNNALYVLGGLLGESGLEVEYPGTLAVHRILHVELTADHVRYSREDDEHGGFGLPWHEPRTFRIRVAPSAADYVRERIWAANQTLEDCEDGGLILTLTTRSEPELRAWVRSFGDAAGLLEDDGSTAHVPGDRPQNSCPPRDCPEKA